MKRVLITGANGFTGNAVMTVLKKKGYEIIPLVRKPNGIENEIVVDLNSDKLIDTLNRFKSIDTLIHLGARIGWDGSSRQELFNPNVLSTGILANWAKRNDIFFVFASAAIICGVNKELIKENSEAFLDSDYAYSKWLAEELIMMSGVSYSILRISGIFGKDGPDHLIINKSIKEAINNKKPIVYGSASGRRNYIYVKDLANIIEFSIDKKIEGTHLIASNYFDSIKKMAEEICDVFIPETKPYFETGEEIADKLVITAELFPKTRTFKDALRDIKNENSSLL